MQTVKYYTYASKLLLRDSLIKTLRMHGDIVWDAFHCNQREETLLGEIQITSAIITRLSV